MGNPNIKNFYLPLSRVHVTAGARWAHEVGTDYWFNPSSGLDQFAAASTATGDELAENGWIATSLVNTAGGAGDFMGGGLTPSLGAGPKGFQTPVPSDMGTPQHGLTDLTGDLLGSPSIFGDYAHAYAAMRLAGKSVMPRYLIMEALAAFTVTSTGSVQSALGFFNAAGTISTEADQFAVIYTDNTDFFLAGAAAKMATGPTIASLTAATWNLWKIVIEYAGTAVPKCYAYVNNTIFSATAGSGVQDKFPLRWGFHSLTNDRIGVGLTRVYYDW